MMNKNPLSSLCPNRLARLMIYFLFYNFFFTHFHCILVYITMSIALGSSHDVALICWQMKSVCVTPGL